MNQIFAFLKTQFSQPKTTPIFGAGIVFISSGLVIGISENPPGLLLTFIGLILIAYSMVHHWEKARDYGTLFAVSLISLPVLILVHNIFEVLNENLGYIPVLTQLFSGLSVISFVGAVLIAPAVCIMSFIVGVYILIRSKF